MAAKWRAKLKAAGHEVTTGKRTLAALAIVVGVAVLREGSEVVLFLYGIVASSNLNRDGNLFAGSLLGSGAGLRRHSCPPSIQLRDDPDAAGLFAVTTLLITFLAAGLAAQAVLFLQQADIVTALSQTAWDTSWILSDTSLFGRVLHTLLGYAVDPSVLQVWVYVITLVAIFARQGNGTRARVLRASNPGSGELSAQRANGNFAFRRGHRRPSTDHARKGRETNHASSSDNLHRRIPSRCDGGRGCAGGRRGAGVADQGLADVHPEEQGIEYQRAREAGRVRDHAQPRQPGCGRASRDP